MDPTQDDIEQLIYRLTTLTDNLHRARRRVMDPTRAAILQAAATNGQVRPSEIAAALNVHQSSVARQTRALEDAGQVTVVADPDDRRSCLISLTEAGKDEVRSLIRTGIERFAVFLDGWDADDVRMLTALLTRLEESVAKARAQEQGPGGRRWQQPGRTA